MSSEPSNLPRLFNPDKSKSRKVPRKEKIVMAILDPNFQLTDGDVRYKNLLIQTAAIMSEYPVLADQVKFVQEISDFARYWCYQVIKDTQYVFGQISTVNKTYLRNAQRERLIKTIEILSNRPKPDWAVIAKYEELLMKLYDLSKHIDGKDEPDEKQSYVIPVVSFTSDPSALLEAEDIDEEE